jgi:hypothetical protein
MAFFSLAISPNFFADEVFRCFWVRGAVFFGIIHLDSTPDPTGRMQATRSRDANHGSI